MTVLEAQQLAAQAVSIGVSVDSERSRWPVKDRPWISRVDPVRYAWERLNRVPFPAILLTRAEEVEA